VQPPKRIAKAPGRSNPERDAKESRSARQRGRPVSEKVSGALAKAAVDEFLLHGYHAMSMESIAASAGVSKRSLYRRWDSKLAVTREVFRILSNTKTFEDQGSLEADLRSLVIQSTRPEMVKPAAVLVMRTMGEISGNPELMAAYREYLLEPRIEQLRTILERARARGELRAGISTDVACTLVAGPLFMYYLAVLAEANLRLPADFRGQFIRLILSAFGA
jgi:AcrR family transcriptional regulator